VNATQQHYGEKNTQTQISSHLLTPFASVRKHDFTFKETLILLRFCASVQGLTSTQNW